MDDHSVPGLRTASTVLYGVRSLKSRDVQMSHQGAIHEGGHVVSVVPSSVAGTNHAHRGQRFGPRNVPASLTANAQPMESIASRLTLCTTSLAT